MHTFMSCTPLAEALAGTWGITEQYEPDKHHHDA
jgi:hypothetical protein